MGSDSLLYLSIVCFVAAVLLFIDAYRNRK